ncbi:hypothetical protein [Clostridium sp. ZS2-4]|uniref:hypothetical protein n=1 Tax=Clostridium sp. ZS2-4 TaxID=2987703 RepID=UPI00227C1A1B|nr:hypothetical protein [Clostridium sp. ZS2-4]MCY6355365.1 hypothetical protein [Clostridium sp. ZS2-4]
MIKRKILLTVMALSMTATITNAKVVGNVVKVNNINYEYNNAELIESFLDYTSNEKDGDLYKDFASKIKTGKYEAFKDENNKYVSHADAVDAFLDASENGQAFNIQDYVKYEKEYNLGGKVIKVNKKECSDNKIVTTNRVTSVKYKEVTIKNNNKFDSSKKYSALARNNVLNKDKILVSMPVEPPIEIDYRITVDYEKSQDSFENLDVLDTIFVSQHEFEKTPIKINFGTEIDKSTINDITIYCPNGRSYNPERFADTEFPLKVNILSKESKSVQVSLKNIHGFGEESVFYLFVNGVKDKNGNILKPMVVPIYIIFDEKPYDFTKSFGPIYDDNAWEKFKTNPDKYDNTLFVTQSSLLLNWNNISDSVNKNFLQYYDLLREVRKRFTKYLIMYVDMDIHSMRPIYGRKVYNTDILIWDRFTFKGEKVDVVSDGMWLSITIYDRGVDWNENPDAMQSIKNTGWGYYFNKNQLDKLYLRK